MRVHRRPARDPQPAVAQQLLHRLRGVSAVDADIAVQTQELAEEGDAEHLALGDPAEVERHAVKGRNIGHRLMVQHDDVGAAPVDMLQPLHPEAPEGGHAEKEVHQHARKFVHRPARLVERPRHNQHEGRHDQKERADDDGIEV